MGSAYREYRPPAGLEPLVACLWENTALLRRPQPVVPDGCVDLVWIGDSGLTIAGADTGPRVVEPTGSAAFGIRLRPGAAGVVLGLPAAEVRDLQVPVDLVWGEDGARIGAAMAEASPDRRLALLTEAVLRRGGAPDPVVAAAAARLADASVRVSGVAADLGLSERQLHRRTLAAVGYGPKTLARVARLRRLIALGDLRSGDRPAGDRPLVERALDAGYASQAHMNAEVRRLTGTTPVRFLKDATLTAA